MVASSRAPPTDRLQKHSCVRFLEIVYFLSRSRQKRPGKLTHMVSNTGLFLFLSTACNTRVAGCGVGSSKEREEFCKSTFNAIDTGATCYTSGGAKAPRGHGWQLGPASFSRMALPFISFSSSPALSAQGYGIAPGCRCRHIWNRALPAAPCHPPPGAGHSRLVS